ncbi:hypothetical protein LCGC14_2262930 [marine sediment metagenome]|uniref:HTH cro/C1-type domain-containing protein n=1 Tax=marine sediment metagenome TaxID=412755 RepID=A0A0F9FBI7_9ZZZZ
MHLCAVKNCVNPLHLYLGTPHDNAQDSINDGTMARGISHGLTKLKNNEVREIRLLASGGLSQRQIAKKFGVSKSSICKIVHYENWGHI